MKEKHIRRHPDTGVELTEEEQDLISNYDSRNITVSQDSSIARFPKPKELLAEPFDRRVTSKKELENQGLKTA